MKFCTRCWEDRPHSEFGKRARSHDGLQAWCKPCVRANNKSWYGKNTAYKLAKNAEWYVANPERARELDRLWIAANPERRAATAHRWTKKNLDYYAEYERKKRAHKRRTAVLPITPEQIAERMAYWGNQCWMCRGPFEHVDHVKPIARGGPHILANLRPACARCNQRKRATWPLHEMRV